MNCEENSTRVIVLGILLTILGLGMNAFAFRRFYIIVMILAPLILIFGIFLIVVGIINRRRYQLRNQGAIVTLAPAHPNQTVNNQTQSQYPSSHGAYPPTQGAYPPTQGAYPPTQGAYPPTQGAYPPTQGSYPPMQGAYPPTQGTYPPQGTYSTQALQPGYQSHPSGYGGSADQPPQYSSFPEKQGVPGDLPPPPSYNEAVQTDPQHQGMR